MEATYRDSHGPAPRVRSTRGLAASDIPVDSELRSESLFSTVDYGCGVGGIVVGMRRSSVFFFFFLVGVTATECVCLTGTEA